MYRTNYSTSNMEYPSVDQHSIGRHQLREIQSNATEYNHGTRRNRFIPPLLQTRPVLKENSDDFSYRPRMPITPNVGVNRMRPSTSTADYYDKDKKAAVAISEMSVQDKNYMVPESSSIPRANNFGSEVDKNNQDGGNVANSNFNVKIFGSTQNEKMFIFTGTVERVIKWNKIFRNHFCYYEVIASVISIQEGSVNTQKIMLLRDKKGPILQVVYYTNTHIEIEDFHLEQVLRCVGRMTAPNILNAVSIRAATQDEINILQRLCLVCDHAVSHFLSV